MPEEPAGTTFRCGFATLVGRPNVGKSTLLNALMGEKISIVTPKPQTTRHRIMGILSGDDFQVVYSDTPGILNPQYALHKSMMKFVSSSLEDADLILFVTDLYEKLNRGVINVHKIIKPHRKNNRKHQASYTRNGGAASLRRRLFSQIQRATEEGNSHQAPTAQGLQKAS